MSILSTLPSYLLSNSEALNQLLKGEDSRADWKRWAFGAFVKRTASHPDHVFEKRWEWFVEQGGIHSSFAKDKDCIHLMKTLELVADGYLELRNERLYVKIQDNEEVPHVAFHPAVGEMKGKYRKSSIFSRWQNLRSRMTTWPIKLLKLYKHGIPGDYFLAHPFSSLLADFIHEEGLNETHLHLNGYLYPEEEWLHDLYDIPRFLREERNAYDRQEPIRQQYYCVNPDLTPELLSHRMLLARILRETVILMLEQPHADVKLLNNRVDEALYGYAATPGIFSIPPSLLFRRRVLQEHKSDEIWMWMKAFEHMEPKSSYEYKGYMERYLHLYLLIQNEHIRLNYHTESRKGFAAFAVSSDHNKLSVGTRLYYENTFYSMLKATEARENSCLEVRVTPKALHFKKQMFVHAFDAAFRKWRKEAMLISRMRGISKGAAKHKPHLILVAHMIKTPAKTLRRNPEDQLLPPLYDAERKQHLREAARVAREARYLRLHHRIPVGLDAANSEMNQPPEVFAPAYRLFDRLSNSGHKTYHCGEDFLHLISGIRAVYEAVEFLRLRDGNRIGHGIAVGIHPAQWVESMPSRLILSHREWLLDMVFVWRLMHETNAAAATKAEREAIRVAHLLFAACAQQAALPHLSIQMLDALFGMREFDPRVVRRYLDDSLPLRRYYAEERAEIEKYAELYGTQVLELYWLWNVNPACRRAQEKLMEVQSEFLRVPELLELQQSVQHLLAKRDVVIETLPVSNLRISQYRDIQEHHLLRWLKIDGYRVENDADLSVCMGSDDPGIFSTDIKNEYYHVMMCLRNAGLSETEAVEKLRMLNRAGRAYSFRELPEPRPDGSSVKSLLYSTPQRYPWQRNPDDSDHK